LVFFAPGTPDKPAGPEVADDIPKANDITLKHINKVIEAADKNIKIITDYYEDYITKMSSAEMPDEIKNNLAQLKTLKADLEKFRFNPPASRETLVKIYDIFTDLDEHTEKTIEDAKTTSDPLKGLGIIAGIYRPSLSTEQTEAKPTETDTRVAETKEQSQEKLVLAAVENIAKAGGVLTQDMLDALKGYKPNVSPLRFDFMIEGNPLTLFVERSADGFAVMGLKRNEEILTPSQAPSWDKAFFRDTYSFLAGSNNPPNIPLKTQEEYITMVEANKLPPEKLA